jgi:hypothetical protein
MSLSSLWWVLSLTCLLACGGRTGMNAPRTDASMTKPVDTVDAALPACSWPTTLDQPDAYTNQCVAARTYLLCQTHDGGETRCGISACSASDYAVSCGGPGPAPPPSLPPGCRSVVSGPSGSIEACCPCGTPRGMDASLADAEDLDIADVSVREAGGPQDTAPPPVDAGTELVFVDAGPDAACSCHYYGPQPEGACAPVGLTCGPPYSCGGGCGEQACSCRDAGWLCAPTPPC